MNTRPYTKGTVASINSKSLIPYHADGSLDDYDLRLSHTQLSSLSQHYRFLLFLRTAKCYLSQEDYWCNPLISFLDDNGEYRNVIIKKE